MSKNESRLWGVIFSVLPSICVILFIVTLFTNNVVKDKNDVEKRNNSTFLVESVTKTNETQKSHPLGNSPAPQNEPILDDLIFGVENYREDGLIFTITADDFIASYNSLYYTDHGEDFILPLRDWVCFSYPDSPFSPYETRYYRFQSDVRWYSEPTIALYIPADSNLVQEITFDYSLHGYTERGYELFIQECTYAFKALFPEYEESEITALFTELRERADEPYTYSTCFSYLDVSFPFLFYKDNIGLFSCSVGQTIHVCVVPVTQELLDSLTANNVEILEL